MGISKEEVNDIVKSFALFSIVPSLSTVIGFASTIDMVENDNRTVVWCCNDINVSRNVIRLFYVSSFSSICTCTFKMKRRSGRSEVVN